MSLLYGISSVVGLKLAFRGEAASLPLTCALWLFCIVEVPYRPAADCSC